MGRFTKAYELLKSLKPHIKGLGPVLDLLHRIEKGQATDDGMKGIVEHLPLFGRLGKLTHGKPLLRKRLQEFISSLEVEAMKDGDEQLRTFWKEVWKEATGIDFDVPPLPPIKPEKRLALEKYGFCIMFLPIIPEEKYPKGFVPIRLDSKRSSTKIDRMEKMPPRSKWVAVEKNRHYIPTVTKSDLLGTEAELDMRELSFTQLFKDCIPRIGLLLHEETTCRIPYLEEWNLIGNIFNWLRRTKEMNLPIMGHQAEWCMNRYNSHRNERMVGGWGKDGGLHVAMAQGENEYLLTSFRTLIEL